MTTNTPAQESRRIKAIKEAIERKRERDPVGFMDKCKYKETSHAHQYPWDFVMDNIEVGRNI